MKKHIFIISFFCLIILSTINLYEENVYAETAPGTKGEWGWTGYRDANGCRMCNCFEGSQASCTIDEKKTLTDPNGFCCDLNEIHPVM
jgi:hypothetical protein